MIDRTVETRLCPFFMGMFNFNTLLSLINPDKDYLWGMDKKHAVKELISEWLDHNVLQDSTILSESNIVCPVALRANTVKSYGTNFCNGSWRVCGLYKSDEFPGAFSCSTEKACHSKREAQILADYKNRMVQIETDQKQVVHIPIHVN